MKEIDFNKIEGFEWDKGNIQKNWIKHQVSVNECEEAFNGKYIVSADQVHSQKEDRFHLLGSTYKGRKLFISFTIRDKKIRIISARNQNIKEKLKYEKKV